MNTLRKASVGLLTALAISSAALANDTIATFSQNVPGSVVITFDGTNLRAFQSGGLYPGANVVSNGALGILGFGGGNVNAVLDFGPVAKLSTTPANIVSGGFSMLFGGANFSLTDSSTGTLLLSGKWDYTTLVGRVGGNSGNVNSTDITGSIGFNNVTYTGGVYMAEWSAAGPFSNPPYSGIPGSGNMSIGLTAVKTKAANGTLSNGFKVFTSGPNKGKLQPFQSNAGGTFDAIATPEPGEWTAMGILATGLGGLVLRARRRA